MYFPTYINIDDRFFSFISGENWDYNLPPNHLSLHYHVFICIFVFNPWFIYLNLNCCAKIKVCERIQVSVL